MESIMSRLQLFFARKRSGSSTEVVTQAFSQVVNFFSLSSFISAGVWTPSHTSHHIFRWETSVTVVSLMLQKTFR